MALSGHRLVRRTCLLLTQSGHWVCSVLAFKPCLSQWGTCIGGSLSRSSAAQRRRGRLRRERSRPSGCGVSAYFWPHARTIRTIRPGSARSGRRCKNWVGSMAATSKLTSSGPRPCRRNSQTRGRVGRTCAGRHSGTWHRDRRAVAAGDAHRADRVSDRRRSSLRRVGRQPRAPGRQRHRFHAF